MLITLAYVAGYIRLCGRTIFENSSNALATFIIIKLVEVKVYIMYNRASTLEFTHFSHQIQSCAMKAHVPCGLSGRCECFIHTAVASEPARQVQSVRNTSFR